MGPNLAQNQVFHIFFSLAHQFFFKLSRMIAWKNVQLLVEIELPKKILGPKFKPYSPKLRQKLDFSHFLQFGSLVFLEIAQDDSLGQCLTSSRGKASEKKNLALNIGQMSQNWTQNQVFHIFLVRLISFPLNCPG